MIIGSQVATSVVQATKINERYNNIDDLDLLAESGISLSKKYFLDEIQNKINSYNGNKIQEILDEHYSYNIDSFSGLKDYKDKGYKIDVSIVKDEASSSDLTGVFNVICKATWNGVEKEITDTVSVGINKSLADNKDIEISKGGFLTQQIYNVDHMETLKDTATSKWGNRLDTYKKDAGLSQFVSAEISNDYEEYTNNKIEDKYPDNSTTNTIFTSHDSTVDEYKEAKKAWGYFRAPRDGWYSFASYADDGISVKFDNQTIIDNFKPKGAWYNFAKSSNKDVFSKYLKKGEFYHIYIEYFNWGGKAKFYLLYTMYDTETDLLKANRTIQNTGTKEEKQDLINTSYSKIPASYFYPSRNPLPPY